MNTSYANTKLTFQLHGAESFLRS